MWGFFFPSHFNIWAAPSALTAERRNIRWDWGRGKNMSGKVIGDYIWRGFLLNLLESFPRCTREHLSLSFVQSQNRNMLGTATKHPSFQRVFGLETSTYALHCASFLWHCLGNNSLSVISSDYTLHRTYSCSCLPSMTEAEPFPWFSGKVEQ